MSEKTETVGVIGAGSFGIALSNILAENRKVLLYSRRKEVKEQLETTGQFKGSPIHRNISVTNDLELLPQTCTLIFPVVPSEYFRETIITLSPYLKPWHILIHGTKGLELADDRDKEQQGAFPSKLSRYQIKTMSELIQDETSVVRVGCVAGPNLANEILAGFPSAAVVASRFDLVIKEGQDALRSRKFRVHGSHDLLGIELAGALKNIIAIASGALEGLGMAYNTRSLLITHGIAEMATIGKALGVNPRAFLGLAGIGDLVATCSSPSSRNFTLGFMLAKGYTLEQIRNEIEETAEGIKTVGIIKALAMHYHLFTPITSSLHKILYDKKAIELSINTLMELPVTEDVSFI